MPPGLGEQIAQEALGAALRDRCRGGSWLRVARSLAWRVVAAGERSPKSIEIAAGAAEAMLVAMIDEALWTIERVVIQSWEEFLEARPGDESGALAAVRLDAREESVRLLDAACERVLEALRDPSRRAA
jgi:hypothetical protein